MAVPSTPRSGWSAERTGLRGKLPRSPDLPRCFARRLAGATGDRRPGPLAVGRDRDSPVVAVAVGFGDHHVLARPGGADVPGGIHDRGGHEVHRHRPVAGPGNRDVEVVPVAALRAGRQRRGAAATATAPTAAAPGVHGDAGVAAAAAEGLGREDLIVERAEVHPVAGPRVEEVLRGDGPAAGGRRADRQVLLEGRGALDGGLVDLLMLVDVVRAAV